LGIEDLLPGSQISSTPLQQFSTDQFPYLQHYGSQTDLQQSLPAYNSHSSQHLYAPQDFAYGPFQHDPNQLSASHQPPYPQHRFSSFDSRNGDLPPPSVESPQSVESVTAEDLAENLGDLRIADTGIAPYIRQQHGLQKEAPAPILDDEEDLPALSTKAGSQIRIPPALMPSDEEASRAFQDYFTHVHPYVPVLCRSHFYHQWQRERSEISPLLLATVLSCAGQVSGDPAGGSQWLALANRHEESFADTPRLSTIQALLLLLKAREKTPKRGYYYRSWILVKKIVAMAKDLDLHEHFESHELGGQCGLTPVECLTKTRVWQVAMIVELMVGAPQGRSDYGVDIETVDTSPTPPNWDIDDYEKMISKQFAYWVRNVRNVRGVTEIYQKLKRKNKEWATDPKFVAYNQDFSKWPGELPADLEIAMPADGSLPRPPSHFVANMHCHYQLGIVMFYKPQLTASKDFIKDKKWKHDMTTCYNAAKQVCAFQEAILQNFDVRGLACMQRGLSFPIYAILTCIMVHLVRTPTPSKQYLTLLQIAITSPDPAYNQDSRDYFIRHMRVLEACIAEWPMPEVEAQINGLRAAFSADLNKPFDLKPSFPYGTPSEHSRSPEERRSSEPQHHLQQSLDQHLYQQAMPPNSFFPTPPVSAGPVSKPQALSLFHDYTSDQSSHPYSLTPTTSNPGSVISPADHWNPTPIIDQFNAAFAIPPSALAAPPPSTYDASPQHAFHQQLRTQQYLPSPTSTGDYSTTAYIPSPAPTTVPNQQAYYSPLPHGLPQQQPTPTPSHYSQPPSSNPFFDSNLNHQQQQAPQHQHHMQQAQLYANNQRSYSTSSDTAAGRDVPVFVTPKEWQQSVASVFDSSGLKRKWDYEQHVDMQQQQQQGPSNMNYVRHG